MKQIQQIKKTKAHLYLRPLSARGELRSHPLAGQAHDDDDDGALFLLFGSDHVLPCTVAHAHDDDALPLLLLVIMSCFFLFLIVFVPYTP